MIFKKLEIEKKIAIEENYPSKHNLLTYPVAVYKETNDQYVIVNSKMGCIEFLTYNIFENKINKINKFSEINVISRTIRKMDENFYLIVDSTQTKVIQLNKSGYIYRIIETNDIHEVDLEIVAIDYDKINNNIIMVNKRKEEIVCINFNGEILKKISIKNRECQEIVAIQVLENNHFLLTDVDLSKIIEINYCGEEVWSYMNNNTSRNDKLAGPWFAQRLSNGNTLIVDKMHSRIIEVTYAGEVIWNYGTNISNNYESGELFYPIFALRVEDETLIADTYNCKVLAVSEKKEIYWQYGEGVIKKRLLSRPRHIQVLDNNELLVSDTLHDRILLINENNEVLWKYEDNLFWPRSIDYHKKYGYIITDSRNNRIVILDLNKRLKDILYNYNYLGVYYNYLDPHYAKWLNNGNILVCDTANNVVMELMSDFRKCCWLINKIKDENSIERELRDPHYISQNENGSLLISDTGNNRLIFLDKNRNIINNITKVHLNKKEKKIKLPKFSRFVNDDYIQFIDNDGYIMTIDKDGIIYEMIESNEPLLKAIKYSRCISDIDDNYIYISDIENCVIYKTFLS